MVWDRSGYVLADAFRPRGCNQVRVPREYGGELIKRTVGRVGIGPRGYGKG